MKQDEYIHQLENEVIEFTKALEEIIEYHAWADYDSILRVAKRALEK